MRPLSSNTGHVRAFATIAAMALLAAIAVRVVATGALSNSDLLAGWLSWWSFSLGAVAVAGLTGGLGLLLWRSNQVSGPALTTPRQLGSYRLRHKIATGGMGEVWQASHVHLSRPAAVKLIRPGRTDDSLDMSRRFEREAQATASLRSPHTVELYDYGRGADGTLYYAMELLSGIDLDECIKRLGPMPADRVVLLMRQICQSLAEAHGAGLVHRDIKPANLFLCPMGIEQDFVKVLDFGLVKPDIAEQPASMLTNPDTSVGTPAFMPPEMAIGEEIDGRADIYSLGCVAFWLLTGEWVFHGKTAYALAVAHAHETPAAPSELVPDIPEELDAVILACLAKSPADRPQSAEELYRRLGTIGAAGATAGRGQSWSSEQARAWWQRHQGALVTDR